ncbi:MAG: DUF3108 domain-containing protein [Desulfobacterales bacterium]
MLQPVRPHRGRIPIRPSLKAAGGPRHFGLAAALICAVALLCLAAAAGAADTQPVFSPGEKLTFQIKWGAIPAGEATLEVLPMESRDGLPVYHFVMQVKTNPVLDRLYYYRSRIDAYADLQMNHSLQYRQTTTTNRKEKSITVDFDWSESMAHFHRIESFPDSKREPHVKKLDTPLLPGTFDPLSAFFYTRRQSLQEQTLIERPISDGKRALLANLEVLRKETVWLNNRSFETFLVQPDLKDVNPVFDKKSGATILIWLSADAHRIPLKLNSQVRIGSFTGELVGAQGVQGYSELAGGYGAKPPALAGVSAGLPES